MEKFLQQLINGLTIGGFYAVVALGYTMVYGVLKLINFAHGDMFMWGTLAGWGLLTAVLASFTNLDLVAILIVSVLVMAFIGVMGLTIERVAYRPLRSAGRLSPIISALGAAFMLEAVARNVSAARWRTYPQGLFKGLPDLPLSGSVSLSGLQILMLVLCAAIMIGLYLFVQRTRIGTAMRAVSLDHNVSRLMGINVDRIISIVFCIGPALGGLAGVLIGIYYGSFNFTLGWVFGLKAFIAAILGGIGNIPGAVLGGFILGISETMVVAYGPAIGLADASSWKDAIAYVLLVVILIARPTGILGETLAQKV
ncbi:MAG TPA: branched-chain amino acid ABC transporter permease [Aggregatilineaceae bacterium]|nr:branched-chain amino acid ABC transporter permease [Aggregatilineaceae bacterium]